MADSTFPNTETFLINWWGGTCGAFITMLMYNILFPNEQIEIAPSDNGNAHTNQSVIRKLYRVNKNIISNNMRHPYKIVGPLFLGKPLILFDHEEPDLDVFFDKFPLGKIIVIRFNNKMVPLMHGNFFFKTIMEYALNEDNDAWKRFYKENDILIGYNSPKDIPSEIIKQLINQMTESYNIKHYYSEQYTPPEQYKDRIYFIDFYDIIFNKSKVLTQLSDITNRPITDFVNDQYDIYSAKQKELMDTKLAWIDLEG